MNQFFVEPSAIQEDKIIITGSDVNHIVNVLRLRVKDEVMAVNSTDGISYTCSISGMNRDEVVCLIEDMQAESHELPVKITLYQGLPKSDKLEFVIQKSVEMGVSRIVPVQMHRSVVRLSQDKADKKHTRWNAIAESAASQSRRSIIPKVSHIMTYSGAISEAASIGPILVPYERAEGIDTTRQILEDIKKDAPANISVFIGPEGGFDDTEIRMAQDAGARLITLGRRILRTETAPIAALAWLTYIFEE